MDVPYYNRGKKILATTRLGNLTGTLVNINGKGVARFMGIPYGKQPIGHCRFKPLEPLESLAGNALEPYDATKPGCSAIQRTDMAYSTEFKTSEECIFLNIFVPLDGDPGPNISFSPIEKFQPKPVLFHIHGGAFIIGSASAPQYDLSNFSALHNTIGVSINYRLNILGFLSFPPAIEDNLGLRDQQMALKWVYQNIKSFGGDPNRITLYGCSAGGASVQYHCLRPESSRYFQNAIISSGVLTTRWSLKTKTAHDRNVRKVLEFFGYSGPLEGNRVLSFLQSLAVEKFEEWLYSNRDWSLQFHPVESRELNMSKMGSAFSRKPILIGVTAEEGNIIPDMFFPREDTSRQTCSRKAFGDGVGEFLFYEPARKFCRQLTSLPETYPIYCYVFDYNCKTRSPIFPEKIYRKRYGKYHSLDIMFFLSHFSLGSYTITSANDLDIFVNKTLAEIVDKFLSAEINNGNAGLPIYEETSQKVIRLTAKGIEITQGRCFPEKISVIRTLRAWIAYALLKCFPML